MPQWDALHLYKLLHLLSTKHPQLRGLLGTLFRSTDDTLLQVLTAAGQSSSLDEASAKLHAWLSLQTHPDGSPLDVETIWPLWYKLLLPEAEPEFSQAPAPQAPTPQTPSWDDLEHPLLSEPDDAEVPQASIPQAPTPQAPSWDDLEHPLLSTPDETEAPKPPSVEPDTMDVGLVDDGPIDDAALMLVPEEPSNPLLVGVEAPLFTLVDDDESIAPAQDDAFGLFVRSQSHAAPATPSSFLAPTSSSSKVFHPVSFVEDAPEEDRSRALMSELLGPETPLPVALEGVEPAIELATTAPLDSLTPAYATLLSDAPEPAFSLPSEESAPSEAHEPLPLLFETSPEEPDDASGAGEVPQADLFTAELERADAEDSGASMFAFLESHEPEAVSPVLGAPAADTFNFALFSPEPDAQEPGVQEATAEEPETPQEVVSAPTFPEVEEKGASAPFAAPQPNPFQADLFSLSATPDEPEEAEEEAGEAVSSFAFPEVAFPELEGESDTIASSAPAIGLFAATLFGEDDEDHEDGEESEDSEDGGESEEKAPKADGAADAPLEARGAESVPKPQDAGSPGAVFGLDTPLPLVLPPREPEAPASPPAPTSPAQRVQSSPLLIEIRVALLHLLRITPISLWLKSTAITPFLKQELPRLIHEAQMNLGPLRERLSRFDAIPVEVIELLLDELRRYEFSEPVRFVDE